MAQQIPIPDDLLKKLKREAANREISLTDLVRETLERALNTERSRDPLFADQAVYCDDHLQDAADNHDAYLYGDQS